MPLNLGLGIGLPFGGSLFSPTQLFSASEPGVFYDPSDLTTMFTDTAGTTPVTAAGQTVARINDKSGRGNNATQATAASRPTYGVVPSTGRRNLLTFTEQFDNAVWTKLNATITANNAVAPDGTTTADLVVSSGGETRVGLNPGIVVANTAYTASIYGKFSNTNGRYLWFRDFFSSRSVGFDLQSGTVTQADAGITGSIVTASNGFFRCTATWTTPSSAVVANQQYWVQSASGTNPSSGSPTGQFLIWGAQLETGSTATAYQRVVSAFDVTEAGVQSLGYLSFDGVDDFLVTPTITPATDKAQVFAGVRKLSDAAVGVLAELSASTSSNNGAFVVGAPGTVASNYTFTSRGTIAPSTTASSYAAPITNVFSGLADISGDSSILRVNGTQAAQSTADQGTGNYLAYPLYIGRRGGTTLPFNGNIFSLIVRFGANLDAATITSTETWVAGKTGVTL